MALTLQNLRDSLRKALGVDSTELDNTGADLLLNTSFWEIADVFKFREKEVSTEFDTVASTIAYDVEDDLLGLQEISIEDPDSGQHTPLREIMLNDYETNYVNQTSSESKPTHYIRRSNEILLYPTPDDIYTIKVYYWKTLDDIASGGPDIPRSWHPMIWMNAAHYGFAESGDLNKAVGYRRLAGLPSLADTKEETQTKEKENRPFAAVSIPRRPYP